MGAYEYGTGNHDCDGDIDLEDFAGLVHCMGGPNAPPRAAGCEACDYDFDGDVDLADFAAFQIMFNRP